MVDLFGIIANVGKPMRKYNSLKKQKIYSQNQSKRIVKGTGLHMQLDKSLEETLSIPYMQMIRLKNNI